MQGTLTGKLGTINKDGSIHITPIWFILDKDGNIMFTTGHKSVKAKNFVRDNRISLCVDDQSPPFSFVIVEGVAEILSEKQTDLLKWTTEIARRYMGDNLALDYGKRNAVNGELLVRIIPDKIIAQKEIAL